MKQKSMFIITTEVCKFVAPLNWLIAILSLSILSKSSTSYLWSTLNRKTRQALEYVLTKNG